MILFALQEIIRVTSLLARSMEKKTREDNARRKSRLVKGGNSSILFRGIFHRVLFLRLSERFRNFFFRRQIKRDANERDEDGEQTEC